MLVGVTMPESSGAPASNTKPGAIDRVERRRPVLWPAVIVSCDGAVVKDCTTRDISSQGAKIAVPRGGVSLGKFHLINVRDRTVSDATVMWRNGTDMGVSFAASKSLPNLAPGLEFSKRPGYNAQFDRARFVALAAEQRIGRPCL